MKKSLIFSFLLIIMQNHAFAANKNIDVGPEIGVKAPEIKVLGIDNAIHSIKQLSKEKGLIILFFRSADWCPFCKRHLIELNEQAKAFTDLGYGLAAISYDNIEILQTFTTKQHISYPLLSDQHNQTISAFNLLNRQYQKGDDHYGIPYPGVVVINSNGEVVGKHFYKGYKQRVKFTELYQKLAKPMK